MALSTHGVPVPDGPASSLAPPPLRLLQPWIPASLRTAPAGVVAPGGAVPRAWYQRLLDLLPPRGAAR